MKKDYPKCRFCGQELTETFVNLGLSPLSNSYIRRENLNCGQANYPLHVYTCKNCFLVQLDEFESPENIFSDYAYFSSYSDSWLRHAKQYTIDMIEKFKFDENSQIIEIASNDGYLLQFFKDQAIPVTGIEPAVNVAEVARKKGIPTITEFFGETLAKKLIKENKQADLLLGNNVLAHVPNINDFVKGLKLTLKPNGVITMEFPHLLNLIEKTQFDTIYHEHFSYLSFYSVRKIFNDHGLKLFDVQEWETHGGSLRIFACHEECDKYTVTDEVEKMLEKERKAGITDINTYQNFYKQVEKIKFDLLKLLISLKENNKQIIAYGAPAKGNTLLNYCGIRTEFIDYTVDKSPHKQNNYLPGTQIPILAPEIITHTKPDYILILPWNLKNEIMEQLAYTKSWGAKFILPIPTVEVI